VLGFLFSIGPIRKGIWRLWYSFLTRRLRQEQVLFLNYAFEEEPAMEIPLQAGDESNRTYIQLYHHVATQADLAGKHVLEVSCGHGGGASYLTRTFRPVQYMALDLNPRGIDFCQQHHRIDGLAFVQGDAENLPFPESTFDVVLNVEASHCYATLPRFLGEVARVLRPGGKFLYADFRFRDGLAEWDKALDAAPLRMVRKRNINAEVLRGLNRNSARSVDLVTQLPKFMQALGRDFAGIKGSRIYIGLEKGEITYRSYCFEKVAE